MKLKYKNIVSFYLLMLILFSSIGFNIISTICDGCNIEYTSIIITNTDNNMSCECCSSNLHENSCCKSGNTHTEDHHRTSTFFAKLKFDSPEAKAKIFKTQIPVIFLHIISNLFYSDIYLENPIILSNIIFSPPPSGRSLLNLICILRN